MKLFISADMEGISGTVHGDQTSPESKDYPEAQRRMAQDVNAAIEGALEAGAQEIVVNDSHGGMRNIPPDELHEAAVLISGSPKPLGMMQGMDSSFQAAFFVGYHAMRGTHTGVLEHTYAGRNISQVIINGKRLGETGVNAALAGYFGVPVVLVTGDRKVTQEAQDILGKVQTVSVKEGVGRYAAACLNPARARALIREAAKEALGRVPEFRPFLIPPPITLEIGFANTGMTEMPELIPGVKRTDGLTLSFQSNNYLETYKVLRVMISLSASGG